MATAARAARLANWAKQAVSVRRETGFFRQKNRERRLARAKGAWPGFRGLDGAPQPTSAPAHRGWPQLAASWRVSGQRGACCWEREPGHPHPALRADLSLKGEGFSTGQRRPSSRIAIAKIGLPPFS